MATKTKTSAKKANKPNVVKQVNDSLLNVSIAAINTTIDNGEKWQKLASKLIKKSEKVRAQQINMIFDTAESVKGQFMDGADKMKDLVGLDDELVDAAKTKVMNNPVSRKVYGIVEDITEKVAQNPMVQKAEKTAEDMKTMGATKFNEIKGDVLKQATNIISKAENKLEDAKAELKKEANEATKKAAKTTTKKASTAKASVAKATTVKKKTTTKVATKAKATAKAANKVVSATPTKKVVAKKVAAVEAKVATAAKTIKAEIIETTSASTKDDLKLIYGIGPKTETSLNKNGINTYADFAKLETAEVELILEKEGTIFSKTEAKDWKKQAEVAVKDGVEGLTKWVERYRTA